MASGIKAGSRSIQGRLREVLQGAQAGLYKGCIQRGGGLGRCIPMAQDASRGAEGAGCAAQGTEAVAHEL